MNKKKQGKKSGKKGGKKDEKPVQNQIQPEAQIVMQNSMKANAEDLVDNNIQGVEQLNTDNLALKIQQQHHKKDQEEKIEQNVENDQNIKQKMVQQQMEGQIESENDNQQQQNQNIQMQMQQQNPQENNMDPQQNYNEEENDQQNINNQGQQQQVQRQQNVEQEQQQQAQKNIVQRKQQVEHKKPQTVVKIPENTRLLNQSDLKQKQKIQDKLIQKLNQQNQSYLNRLQRQLSSQIKELQNAAKKNEILLQKIKSITDESQKNKLVVIQLRKNKLEADKQSKKVIKQLQKVKKQNTEYKQKLIEVQQIGNVFSIKEKIEEMKVLNMVQSQQIMQLKSSIISQQNNQQSTGQFAVFQRLQHELNLSKHQNSRLNVSILQLQTRLSKMQGEKETMLNNQTINTQNIRSLNQEKLQLENKLREWQSKWQMFEQQRQQGKRLKQLDQNILHFQSSRNMRQQSSLPNINFLSDKQEKQILLKEYLLLEVQYEKVKHSLQMSEKKIKTIQRQNRLKEDNFIRKKDYLDLSAKYKKAKSCLYQAFIKLKQRSQGQNIVSEIRQEINELLEGNQAKLCQNVIRQTTEHLRIITQKTNSIEINDQISNLRIQNQKLIQKNAKIERQMKSNQRVMFLLNDQVQINKKIIAQKTKMINELINNGYSYNNEHFQDKIARCKNEIQMLRQQLIVYENSNLMLINKNSSYLAQINHWKELYNSIKQSFIQKINSQHEPSRLFQIHNEADNFNNRDIQVRYQAPLQTIKQSIECQTENLYEMHYKEIKQSLMILKNLKIKIQAIPQLGDQNIKLVMEFKERYEKVLEKYNGKLMELQREKAQNQSWRSKVKEDIRQEFQDIRELITNNRLVTALRQAKSLIEYLENQQQKMNAEEQVGKGQEEEQQNQQEQKNSA